MNNHAVTQSFVLPLHALTRTTPASRFVRRLFALGLIWSAYAVTASCPAAATAATLQALFGGVTLTVGNARFDNWQLLSADHTSGAAFDFSLMSMSAIGSDPSNPGLQFASGGQLAVTGINAADLTFRFQVHAIGASNSFAAHSLNMTGVTFSGPGGIATISQEVTTIGGVDLGPAVTLADNVADVFEFADTQAIAPHLNLQVTVNVFVTGLVAADAINFTAFTQRFAQTGPATLPGDFNNDKKVDGADFLHWQRGLSPSPLSQGDLTVWKNNFGQSILATPAVANVPEPCGVSGALLAGAFALSRRARRRPGS
ncbi:hypothetical protein [Lacipirellula parvula]|uniref:PEP-CTERM protein-sorting domain-containing protein n=1 Tax=Lacipirellula parvula TaxID=2650471 RepID=A0A5K7X7V6_9BACT|nr:hypothetical protein [Lacipirellula parvula]BBO31942.1 hypothetical protein PLANPX_1554 [Lacipirellula parvula]